MTSPIGSVVCCVDASRRERSLFQSEADGLTCSLQRFPPWHFLPSLPFVLRPPRSQCLRVGQQTCPSLELRPKRGHNAGVRQR